ncbi:hypothetical protein CC1G_15047 [Coprinopsis cinerea okayama7|uniref:Uncharacterized protein n=1 Tax=Coprinopsis cinerea (strain Okayama-7 / 130 / ATCC MYA-4618 / FGSC 9003) TaxID=240176 RepID=D6RP32_COPC7|nr:hypothetical protein CC1G_15047 [Coprinopsis cinerea okayama7\|eukprot:XP_002910713.1 hypothetical protein CC1G_15047 [Coprinopsis cinerea okayama7\
MASQARIEELPSMLWVAVPSVLLVSAYFVRKWYLSYRLKVHGIGRGAKGFQTNVRQVRVTPEIAERLRRGEEVSPEEIAAAAAKMEELERQGKAPAPAPRPPPVFEDEKPFYDSRTPRPPSPPRGTPSKKTNDNVDNEWLPDTVTKTTKRKTRGKKA